jgi:outer membrane protein assembly factor BamB
VSRGSIFFGGGDGFFYSVNSETGRVHWRSDLRNPVVSRPTVVSGRVFVTTSEDVLFAFDAGTGKLLWQYKRKGGIGSSARIYGASAPLIDSNEVLAGFSDGYLVCLSLEEGSLKWEKKLHFGKKFTDVNAHPVLDGGVLYVPSYDGSIYALRRKDGSVLWRVDSGGSKEVLIEEDRLYFPSSDGTVYALQKSSGKVLWKFQLDGGTPTQLAFAESYIVVGSTYQYLYLIDKATGRGVYRMNAGYGSGFSGSPVYDPVQHRAYALSGAGNLYSLQIRK